MSLPIVRFVGIHKTFDGIQRVVEKADSGTGWPCVFSALMRSKSSGCMRDGASA